MPEIIFRPFGEFGTNTYLVVDSSGRRGVLIDPGAEPEEISAWIGGRHIERILLTHAHPDHTGALADLRETLGAPVLCHPADATVFDIETDFRLEHEDVVAVGSDRLQVAHIPGHTPGSVALRPMGVGDAAWAIVGDAIFPGGPGHTGSPEGLRTALRSLERTVFTWKDETRLYPGHGEPTTVGAEREAFEAFMARDLPEGLHGDVTWR
jgi:glyoxylase-like metal-dependent hydrolase (beta-lactamase superfamily II)